jgi:protoheme IX farnesyltransferase
MPWPQSFHFPRLQALLTEQHPTPPVCWLQYAAPATSLQQPTFMAVESPSPFSATVAAATPSAASSVKQVAKDYFSLTKPEISFLVAISALAGYLLGTPGPVDAGVLLALLAGVAFSSGGGAAFNLCLEKELDGQMKRTADRPLPSGRITVGRAFLVGTGLSVAGLSVLLAQTNLLTMLLAAFTIGLYVLLYTPLKQHTKYNTLVGTLPGALPALGGWTAATGSFGLGGWLLFAILVIWQLPHFLSLAWMYRKDYSRAGFKMYPVVEPEGGSTVFQVVAASGALLVASVLPAVFGFAGALYAAGASAFSLWLLFASIVFARTRSNADARRVLKVSIYHIPALVLFIVLDRLV